MLCVCHEQLLIFFFFPTALATSCQVYSSEYAYKDDSVSEQYRRYRSNLQEGVFIEQYTYCDGTQLKLTDSDLGQGQYQTRDYYVWFAGSGEQLLFIFPMNDSESLTTITLHYYSDSVRDLPRLSFFAVPGDFYVWDALTTGYPRVDVASFPPDREPAGRRSVSINTKKVLMYRNSSTFWFAVSEVEFFTCSGE